MPQCDQMLLICSAGPRGLCGDPRIFDHLTKVPQVFRNPGGSPALQSRECERAVAQAISSWLLALRYMLLLAACALQAAIPTPQSHFGHEIGIDRKLLDWDRVVSYFRALEQTS